MEENKNLELKHEDVNLEVIEDETINRNMGIWESIDKFENAQRMAKALSTSTMVPKEYQGTIS